MVILCYASPKKAENLEKEQKVLKVKKTLHLKADIRAYNIQKSRVKLCYSQKSHHIFFADLP